MTKRTNTTEPFSWRQIWQSGHLGPFADQFEPDGANYIYRRNKLAGGVRVTSAEHDAFLARFGRDQKWMMRIFAALSIPMLILSAMVNPAVSNVLGDRWTQIVALGAAFLLSAMCVWIIVIKNRSWSAPARALAGRAAVGAIRTRAQLRHAKLRETSWRGLAGLAILFVACCYICVDKRDLGSIWSLLWIAFGAGNLVYVGWLAIEKWRSSNPPA
jgi:hypothetical protein